MAGKSGFKTVDNDIENLEDIEEKIRTHRRRVFRRTITVIILILVVIAFVQIWFSLRTYDSYEVINTVEQGNKSATHFVEFSGQIAEYSNDGIVCKNAQGELIWNQAFEMNSPETDTCKNYMTVYDKGGKDIYIMQSLGVVKHLETSMLIRTVCIADQGTVAVLMEEDNNFYVKLYDKTGKELASGKFYGSKGGIPVDIALSHNAQKLAVDMVDITRGNVDTTISFYNFGSVGQNEIDNNVGTFTYEDTLIPEIDYVSDNTMVAICDNSVKIFEGSQKPELSKEIIIDQEMESVFHSDKYVGLVYSNQDENSTHHIKVYDMRAKLVMENDSLLTYTNVQFLSNNEILVNDAYSCELFTIHSIKKFSHTFDKPLYAMLYNSGVNEYTIISEDAIEEVRLK